MVGSTADWPLSEQGLRQAEMVAKNLYQAFKDSQPVLYTSDLQRARQTAQPIANLWGIQPMEVPALKERHLGRCVGQSVQWLKDHQEREEHTIDDRLFSDAESRRDVYERLKTFYATLAQSDDPFVIIVSHGDAISVFMTLWLGIPVASLNSAQLFGQAGGVSVLIEDERGKKTIQTFNDRSYLNSNS